VAAWARDTTAHSGAAATAQVSKERVMARVEVVAAGIWMAVMVNALLEFV
jgi:hypothetical protein